MTDLEPKAIHLNKDTLRNMTDSEMDSVNGGITPIITISIEICTLTIIILGDE